MVEVTVGKMVTKVPAYQPNSIKKNKRNNEKNNILSILCLLAGVTFGQKGETTVIIEITSIKPDSIWVADYGNAFFAKPDKDNKYVLHFTHDKSLKVRIGFDQPEKRDIALFLEPGGQLNIVSDFDKRVRF